MRLRIQSMWKMIKYNMVSLLLFEAGYRVATFLIIMNLTSAAMDYCLRKQNFSYLTAENFLRFLKSPISLLFLTAILLLLLFFFLIEISALLSCFSHSYQKRKIYTSDMLIEGVRRTVHFLKHSRVSWILCILIAAPFLCVYFLISEISYFGVFQYSVMQIYKWVKPHWILYLAVGIILVASFLAVFSLPYCLLEERKSGRGLKSGMILLKWHWKRIIFGFLALHVVIIVVTIAVYFGANAVAAGYAILRKPNSAIVSAMLIYNDWIRMGIGIFAGALQLMLSLAFVYFIYARYHIQQRKEAGVAAIFKEKAWYKKIGQRRAAAILTAILIVMEGSYLVVLASDHSSAVSSLMSTTGVTAHRGAALMAPENTISALDYTVECGADYAEIDVQETADGELVLLHDNSLKRTAGVKKNVWEMTYAEIAQLDAGSSFNKKFRGEKIPTLDEVLKFCRGKLDLNIEIKYNGQNKGIVKKVVRIIEQNHFEDHCVITSMNYSFLKQVKKSNPNIRTGYIMTMTYGTVARIEAADFFSVKYTYVDENFVREAHSFGKEVHAWTVNYRGDIKRMLDVGVDNIITDNPVLVRKVENQESDMETGFLDLMRYAFKL